MAVPDFLFSFIIAFCISALFAWLLSRKGPRKGFVWFFLLILFAILTAGMVITTLQSPSTGSSWILLLLAGMLMALLLFYLAPRVPPVNRDTQLNREETMALLDSVEQGKQAAALAYISLKVFCWIEALLLLILILSVVL